MSNNDVSDGVDGFGINLMRDSFCARDVLARGLHPVFSAGTALPLEAMAVGRFAAFLCGEYRLIPVQELGIATVVGIDFANFI